MRLAALCLVPSAMLPSSLAQEQVPVFAISQEESSVQFSVFGMNSGVPFIKIADRVEVTVDLKGKRVSGPPLVFKQ